MGVPKVNLSISKSGIERQEELINMISDKSLFFPKGIYLEDLDYGVNKFVEDELSPTIDNKKPKTIFMTKQKWADFLINNEIKDDEGNAILPFISLKHDGSPKQGSNESLKYTIAQNSKHTYARVPTFEDGKFSLNIYRIPQPTSVDIEYEVSFFTHFQTDINLFNERLLYKFASGQSYILINGYYMPIMLESTDVDNDFEFDGENFYKQSIRLKLIGFLHDSETFQIERTIRDINLNIEMVKNYTIYRK